MSAPLVSDGEGVVALSFSANMQYVRPVRHIIQSLCQLAEYEDTETEEIQLVATEILNNSIEHGSDGPADEISVLMRVTVAEFCFQVTDPGRGGAGFAKDALNRADTMPDIEEPRGRGLFLIHRFMDDLDVSWEPDRGTRTIVSKVRTQ
jgi:anti-sigma regulatory factor (Ser/Thr protein kinase)